MKIIGFNLSKILVQRSERKDQKVEISQNIDIKDIFKEKIPISESEALKLIFNFSINYSNDFAKLEFEGHLLLLPDKKEMKDFLESWKEKKVPEETRIPLFNFIMGKCNIRALNLEDELGLPLHVPMPKLSVKKE